MVQIVTYVGYFLFFLVMLLVMGAVYYFMSFNLKGSITQLVGRMDGAGLAVGKTITTRVRKIKVDGVEKWQPMWPLMNKIYHPVFEDKHIYRRGHITAFDVGGKWIPMEYKITPTEEILDISVNPVPNHIREWQSMKYKQNALDFAKTTFWDENKHFILGVITVFICCVITGVTVYLSLKFAAGNLDVGAIKLHTEALNNFGTIPANT